MPFSKKPEVNVNSEHHNLSYHKHRLNINIVDQIQENQVILHMIKDVSNHPLATRVTRILDMKTKIKPKKQRNISIYKYIYIQGFLTILVQCCL
jgi:hypothetical protein